MSEESTLSVIPFSAEAVNDLVAMERKHKIFLDSFIIENICISCWDRFEILKAARASASEETLVAVALIMQGEC